MRIKKIYQVMLLQDVYDNSDIFFASCLTRILSYTSLLNISFK